MWLTRISNEAIQTRRNVEWKSKDYTHVLEQLIQASIQRKDLEVKIYSIVPTEAKDILELKILF